MAPIPAAITQRLGVVFLITSSLIEEPDLQRQAGAVLRPQEVGGNVFRLSSRCFYCIVDGRLAVPRWTQDVATRSKSISNWFTGRQLNCHARRQVLGPVVDRCPQANDDQPITRAAAAGVADWIRQALRSEAQGQPAPAVAA